MAHSNHFIVFGNKDRNNQTHHIYYLLYKYVRYQTCYTTNTPINLENKYFYFEVEAAKVSKASIQTDCVTLKFMCLTTAQEVTRQRPPISQKLYSSGRIQATESVKR